MNLDPPPGAARPWRTLIIEDNRAFAENIAELLEEDGHEPHCFAKAEAALGYAQAHGFDLAFLDVRLPDANGTDVLVQLKACSPLAEVIVMSGDATIESAIATVRGGAFAFLLKPFATEEVLRLASMATRQVSLRREREALVRRLEHSEERYRTVVEVSPALLIAVDEAGFVTLVNAAVERTTGFARTALLGRAFETLLPEAQREGAWPRRDHDGPFELSLATHDGGERRIEWRTGVSEELVYLIGIDVTETRAIERRVRAAEQLAMVGELTAGLAHEIRNPLNSALLELKVLTRRLTRAQDAAGTASVDVVRGELERLERLLADFLWFARPGGRSTLPGNLNTPAESVARLVASEAAERGIAVTTDLAADLAAVSFDEDRIRQVLFNLVRNALEALQRDGHIVLRTRDRGGRAEVEVEDDGPGIVGDAQRVFHPFHTTKETGTGLGLTIAQRIASDHGGELRVESRPGRTVFTLSLPALRR